MIADIGNDPTRSTFSPPWHGTYSYGHQGGYPQQQQGGYGGPPQVRARVVSCTIQTHADRDPGTFISRAVATTLPNHSSHTNRRANITSLNLSQTRFMSSSNLRRAVVVETVVLRGESVCLGRPASLPLVLNRSVIRRALLAALELCAVAAVSGHVVQVVVALSLLTNIKT